MLSYKGKSVNKGITMGPVVILNKDDSILRKENIEDVKAELKKLSDGIVAAKTEFKRLADTAQTEGFTEAFEIIKAQETILSDEVFINAIIKFIEEEKTGAEYALQTVGRNFADMFLAMEDAYMKSRAEDVKAVTKRLIGAIAGFESASRQLVTPSVVIAADLTPGDTIALDRSKVLALVTINGSVNSHTAILSRIMDIPALVGVPVDMTLINEGMTAVVDGTKGEIIFEPTNAICENTQNKINKEEKRKLLLSELKGLKNVTKSGKEIKILANSGSVEDIEASILNDAEGIGLFRSEFLYLGREDFPSEEEQYEVYADIVSRIGDKKLVIRTLDIGADKQVPYLNLAHEENPALGYRGIRICLSEPRILKTQLKALFRAAVGGNVSVLYPMIISVDEVKRISKVVDEACEELQREGKAYRVPNQGIMIETPAAAMISDELAEYADFFSIGTNDLAQYSLAIDRQNDLLDSFFDPYHPALFKMIELVTKNAHKAGKKVCICGEMGSDATLTERFINLGIDELSVSPAMILELRKIVRDME